VEQLVELVGEVCEDQRDLVPALSRGGVLSNFHYNLSSVGDGAGAEGNGYPPDYTQLLAGRYSCELSLGPDSIFSVASSLPDAADWRLVKQAACCRARDGRNRR
jgi:hypothetical protein